MPGIEVFGVRSLAQVVALLKHEQLPEAPAVAASSGSQLLTWRGEERLDELDLADLHGLVDTKYAARGRRGRRPPAAAVGPEGIGQDQHCRADCPTILPDLTAEESLELTAVHSLAGTLDPADGLLVRPPFAAPHHDASKASIIGGGNGQVHPGEISRAHCGVLFLDEFPLFRSDVIEALRQPLESGDITIARRDESVTLPAGGMLVLASNPCPCGNFTANATATAATAPSRSAAATRQGCPGPIADRIDIVRHVQPAAPAATTRSVRRDLGRGPGASGRGTRAPARAVRGLQLAAQQPDPQPTAQGHLAGRRQAQQALDRETYRGRLSARGAVRAARVAWTVADLASVRTGRRRRAGTRRGRDRAPAAGRAPLDLRASRSDRWRAGACRMTPAPRSG